jgi:NodT family efflux transporter outer membrane factor (OMF) lipoprotein
MRRISTTLAALPLLLGACTLGPDFERPPPPAMPPAWNSATAAEPPAPDWWSAFGDAELTRLEERVAAANLDLRAATLRLAESRAQRRITGADEFPQITGNAIYQRVKPSAKGPLATLSQGAPVRSLDFYQYGFDALWELDLWGKVRRATEAADAQIEASAEARRDALVSVLAEVARDYLQLRGIQAQLRISKANQATAQDILDLTRKRAANGLSSQLDVADAAAQLATTQSDIPQLEQRQAQIINQLSFLLGQPPGALSDELITPAAVPPPPPRVPVGLPSELAERRPDIRQAEARLHAATAQIGVAKADFYPRITLSASFAMQAAKFADLANWDARSLTGGPLVSIPIFEGGKLSGNLALTETRQQEAALDYQRTVLSAWQEVADALVAYQAEQHRREQISVAVEQNRRALKLARSQYSDGFASFLQVLTAQQQLLAAEQKEADSITTVSANLVALYKALGGGWETTFPREEDAPPAASPR